MSKYPVLRSYSLPDPEGIEIIVEEKRIRSLRLRIKPPHESVYISVPTGTSARRICDFINANRVWINDKLATNQSAKPVKEINFDQGDTLPLWGKPYPVVRQYSDSVQLQLTDQHIVISAPTNVSRETLQKLCELFYRQQVRHAMPALLEQWLPVVGKPISFWGVKTMKTRWGSCNIGRQRIWLNSLLAKYPKACLECVLVHELTHLHERLHSKRFYALMAQFLPEYQTAEQFLDTQATTRW